MKFRFSLSHSLPVEALQFTNNEFELSLTGWSQIGGGSEINFTWNNPSSAKSAGSAPNTSGIGQRRPDDPTEGWPPGTYTVQIIAINASTGGSAPLMSVLNIWGSDAGITFDDSITYGAGTGEWNVGAGEITRTVQFTLAQYHQYLFFKFIKAGPTSGYNVDFTVKSIIITAVQGASTVPLEISEPDGWAGAKIKLERHQDFFSLIEYYEGAANGAFIFYGDNGVENGGIDFIRAVELAYGFDANIIILIEYAPDDETFQTVFSGLLDLSQKNEMKDNKMQIPVIRDDFWAKFINRYDTPVSLSKLEDLDGNIVDEVEPITVELTSQKVRQNYDANSSSPGVTDYPDTVIANGTYYAMSFDDVELGEIEEDFILPQVDQVEQPVPMIELTYAGTYSFNIQTVAYDYLVGAGGYNFAPGEDLSDYIRFYININGTETEFAIGNLFQSDNTDGGRIYTLTLNNQVLEAGSHIRIYGRAFAALIATPNWDGEIRWNGPLTGNISINGGALTLMTIGAFMQVTADTTFPSTRTQGYLIHDLIHGVLARIGLGTNPFYSEFLGGFLTNARLYDEDGCGWMYLIIKGLQLRQYSLTEKPFFISMKEIWEGINPILNLGLGYEIIEDVQVIRIEQKLHWIGDTPPINFSNVREISSSYDKEYIFKKIITGYKEWQSEQASGLDDPQAKHTYATRFEKVGRDLDLESGFIAASLAIEQTRRTTREKSADYKYDNKTFIISLNTDDLSPDVYKPELNENFGPITNLLNADTRYNTVLTPLRNLLRWADYLCGCLQSYLTSGFKFVSGEGNYDMTSDATLGACERAVIGDDLSEKQDILLTDYGATFGYFFLPMEYDITIPMEKEEFDLIDRKQPIGISQTEINHAEFHIKELEYEIVKGETIIKAWPKVFFNITVPEQEITMPDCAPEVPVYDPDYQAILDYATEQGEISIQPSDANKALQNQFLLALKAAGIWDELDILYVFATDGQGTFPDINWKNPGTFTLTGVAAYQQNEGYSGNAINYVLETGWSPGLDGVHFTLDEAGVFCYVNNNPSAGTKAAFGVRGNGGGGLLGQVILMPEDASSQHSFAIHNSAPAVGAGVNSQGFFHIRRVADNDSRLFKNGAQVGATITTASDSLSTHTMYILALNANGVGAGFWTDAEIGIFGAGASLTGKEAALNTAWDNYFNSL